MPISVESLHDFGHKTETGQFVQSHPKLFAMTKFLTNFKQHDLIVGLSGADSQLVVLQYTAKAFEQTIKVAAMGRWKTLARTNFHR